MHRKYKQGQLSDRMVQIKTTVPDRNVQSALRVVGVTVNALQSGGKRWRFKSSDTPCNIIDNNKIKKVEVIHMGRTEIVEARKETLEKLSDKELAAAVVAYFGENKTMPGEKDLKDRATILSTELNEGKISGVTSEVRKDLIEEFTTVLVKETKITENVVLNENKKNKDAEGVKAGDLPMILRASEPIPNNTMKNTYELPVTIGEDGSITENATANETKLGTLPKGFMKNHPNVCGMSGTVIATDYSNGKFANMSYSVVIDLGQRVDEADLMHAINQMSGDGIAMNH